MSRTPILSVPIICLFCLSSAFAISRISFASGGRLLPNGAGFGGRLPAVSHDGSRRAYAMVSKGGRGSIQIDENERGFAHIMPKNNFTHAFFPAKSNDHLIVVTVNSLESWNLNSHRWKTVDNPHGEAISAMLDDDGSYLVTTHIEGIEHLRIRVCYWQWNPQKESVESLGSSALSHEAHDHMSFIEGPKFEARWTDLNGNENIFTWPLPQGLPQDPSASLLLPCKSTKVSSCLLW